MKYPITVLIADEHYLVRVGLRHLLGSQPQIEILGEAKNQEELFGLLEALQPQVVLLDYKQPGCFDHTTIQQIKHKFPQTNIMVISADNEKESIFQVLEYGVNSFLTKTCEDQEITDAVTACARNEKFFCTKILDYVLERTFSRTEENCAPMPLSPREVEIVRLVAKGLIAKEIAGELHLSTHTVYTHRKNIMRKLKISSSPELVLYAVQNGILV